MSANTNQVTKQKVDGFNRDGNFRNQLRTGPNGSYSVLNSGHKYPITLCLTARQRDVLNGIIKGHSNKEIAREIGISFQTVKIHVSEILRRLNVRNRTEAVILVFTDKTMGLVVCASWTPECYFWCVIDLLCTHCH